MVKTETLASGARLVYEPMESVRSVAIGVWVASGTRHEPAPENGISHFIEHMVFKGTEQHNAAELAQKMDVLGGEVNAFTTKECTCFYGRVPDVRAGELIDLLEEMLFESRYAPESVETERGVILEEIGMYEDNPEDLAAEKLMLGIFAKTPLGMPILGTRETLSTITGEKLRQYRADHYTGPAVVVSVAGRFSSQDLEACRALCKRFARGKAPTSPKAFYSPYRNVVEKPMEQNHITLAFPALSRCDEGKEELLVLNSVLGGNMSSRLFQRVREQLGLCYSVYSFLSAHNDTGALGIYVGTGRGMEEKALKEIGVVLTDIVREGITQEELDKVLAQLEAGLLMGLESTVSRMNHMGKSLLLTREVLTPEEIGARYRRVTVERVNGLARKLLRPELLSLSAVVRSGKADLLADVVIHTMK